MPRRRRSDNEAAFDAMIAFLRDAPWWMGAVVAALAYVGFRYAIPFAFSLSPPDDNFEKTFSHTVIQISTGVAPIAAGLVAAGWMLALAMKLADRHRLQSQTGIDSVRGLGWMEFERLLCEAFRRQGYRVQHSGSDSPDGGVDIRLERDGLVTLVQCKHWQRQSVGVAIVRELLGVMSKEGAARGIVVTSGGFTRDAQAFADGSPITLIGADELVRLIDSVKGGESLPTADESAVKSTAPSCPTCGLAMVERVAKKGRNAGSRFWGCPEYPRCKGTRDM